VVLAKNGLTGFTGWVMLGCFLGSVAAARGAASMSLCVRSERIS
jgi:hypothetical protein